VNADDPVDHRDGLRAVLDRLAQCESAAEGLTGLCGAEALHGNQGVAQGML
jgi:hypothetical protein